MTTKRLLGFLAVASIGLLVSCPLLHDALRVSRISDLELIARFRGASFEDIFGFGFWIYWMLLATVEVTSLGLGWVIVRKHALRYCVAAPLVVFAATTFTGYRAYTHEYTLWLKHTH